MRGGSEEAESCKYSLCAGLQQGGVTEKQHKSAGEKKMLFFFYQLVVGLDLEEDFKHKGVGPLHLLLHHLKSRCAPLLIPPTTVE